MIPSGWSLISAGFIIVITHLCTKTIIRQGAFLWVFILFLVFWILCSFASCLILALVAYLINKCPYPLVTIWDCICLMWTADGRLKKCHPLADLDVSAQTEQVERLSASCELGNKCSVRYVLMSPCHHPQDNIWSRFFFLNSDMYFENKIESFRRTFFCHNL